MPHFQDTYGWLLVLRGDHEQALSYLEPAAEAMADEALVQYHLGMAYDALDRRAEARAALTRAVNLGPSRPGLPQLVAARAKIREIDALLAEARADG